MASEMHVEESGEISLPEVAAISDFDGYFKNYVVELVNLKHASGASFKHSKIEITSGPWRMYDVSYKSGAGTLHLDFYSVCRFSGPNFDAGIVDQL